MAESTIVCPHCGGKIDLDTLAEHRYNDRLQRDEARLRDEFAKKEQAIKQEYWQKAQEKAREKMEEEYRTKDLERKELEERVKVLAAKQEESAKNELALRRRAQEIEDREKALTLELARKMDEERVKITEDLKRQSAEQGRLESEKLSERYAKELQAKDEQMRILKQSLEEANRKALQGSQQIQGELQEHELKRRLEANFPSDRIEDVPTGMNGADLIQRVRDEFGREAGVILWESKNTKVFSQTWVKKLRDDRVLARADLCVIVSAALPDGIEKFGQTDGMWVTELASAMPLASALRAQLVATTSVRTSMEGRDEKMSLLYDYLSSQEFRSKVENIIEAFRSMRDGLESEKRAMKNIWAKREKELDRVINNTALFYGDMQGIMGNRLASVPALELGGGEDYEDDDGAQSQLVA